MIKDFEEYKIYRSRLSTEGISDDEFTKLDKEMDEFVKTHPEIFDKLNKEKWSCKGLNLCNPDGSIYKKLK